MGPHCPVCSHAGELLKTEIKDSQTYRTYRCGSCRSLFCNDHYAPISPDYVSRTAEDIDDFVLWCQGAGKIHTYRQLFRALEKMRHPVRTVLDFGCGTGGFLRHARELGITSLYGFDASAAQVAVAKKDFPAVGRCDSLLEYTNSLGSVPPLDLITLWDVIEHLRDPARALAEIRAVCSPQTMVLLCTPNGSSEFVKLHMRRLLHISHSFIPWEHVLYFSKQGLRLMVEKHGFEVALSVAAACYRRRLTPVELIRRLGFAASSKSEYGPQLFFLCRSSRQSSTG